VGTGLAVIAFGDTGVPGIKAVATNLADLQLKPKQLKKVGFKLQVEKFVAPGDYKIPVSLSQTNLTKPNGGQIGYAPGIAGSAIVRVSRTSAQLTVTAVNSDDGTPISGTLVLRFLPGSGQTPLDLLTVQGSTLTAKVIAGNYEAFFSIPGLVQQSKKFSIATGETKSVLVEIQGVRFVIASAKPSVQDGEKLVAIELAAVVRNQVARLTGPIRFRAVVVHDGKLFERLTFATLAELPIENTEQRSTYAPKGGFTPGEWRFHFVVQGPSFAVASAKDPVITVNATFPWWILLTLAGLAAVGWFLRDTRAMRTAWPYVMKAWAFTLRWLKTGARAARKLWQKVKR
ncbi:MAG: hypothetical protein WCO24_02965, partial [Actinomycetes bacterium]